MPSGWASAGARCAGRRRRSSGRGRSELVWRPAPETPVGSYVMRLTVGDNGKRRVYGRRRPAAPERAGAPVVRVLGVEASFARRSYLPEEPWACACRPMRGRSRSTFLASATARTRTCEATSHRSPDGRPGNDRLDAGSARARARSRCSRATGPAALYAAQLETHDGRFGFAPFVLRPTTPGETASRSILPTNTWQAYNLYDADGDGWGDTWYAGGHPPVRLDRPYRDRGVPPRFRRYDFPFLRWLEKTRREPDILADDDLEAFPSGDDLRRLYDLVVFPGHSEYMTAHAYDVVERYRDLGGRLVFLSANNFFWGVEKRGNEMRRGRAVAYRCTPRGPTLRRPVPGERRRPAPGAVRRQRPRRSAVALRGHRPRAGRHARRGGRRVRDRDRHDDAGLPAGHAGTRLDPEPLRARAPRRDDATTRPGPAHGCSRPGSLDFPAVLLYPVGAAADRQPLAPHAGETARRRPPARAWPYRCDTPRAVA